MSTPHKPALNVLGPRDFELGPFSEAGPETGPWTHWRMRQDADGIAWLLFDNNDARVNTLSEAVLTELDSVLAQIERDRPRGLAIRSAKPGGFIAGADIAQLRGVTDPTQVVALLTRGHAV